MRKTTLLSVCLPLLFANVLPSIADNGKSLEIEGVTRIDQADGYG